MLVTCPHRSDHKTNRSRMHSPSQCPPPAGERGDHRRLKRLNKKKAKRDAEFHVVRGEAVAGVGGSKVAGNRNKKKAKT